MRTVLIDASSAILLYKADLFATVAQAYPLAMTPAVYREVTVNGRQGADFFMHMRGRGSILELEPGEQVPAQGADLSRMGGGERETLQAYLQIQTGFVILDDYRGARFCRERSIPYVNALLCPKLLHVQGFLPERDFRTAFDCLSAIGHYSAAVIRFARECPHEVLKKFMVNTLRS